MENECEPGPECITMDIMDIFVMTGSGGASLVTSTVVNIAMMGRLTEQITKLRAWTVKQVSPLTVLPVRDRRALDQFSLAVGDGTPLSSPTPPLELLTPRWRRGREEDDCCMQGSAVA